MQFISVPECFVSVFLFLSHRKTRCCFTRFTHTCCISLLVFSASLHAGVHLLRILSLCYSNYQSVSVEELITAETLAGSGAEQQLDLSICV